MDHTVWGHFGASPMFIYRINNGNKSKKSKDQTHISEFVRSGNSHLQMVTGGRHMSHHKTKAPSSLYRIFKENLVKVK